MGATTTSSAQHMQALGRANEIRLARAGLKRRLRAGDTTAAEVILSPPEEALTWPVGDLLLVQRGWGRDRMRRFLAQTGMARGSVAITVSRTVGGLSGRERELLARMLDRPIRSSGQVCPTCGGRKALDAKMCWSCRYPNRKAGL